MDLIDRQAAIDALKKQMSDWNDDYNVPVRKSIENIERLPSTQPEPCEDAVSRQAVYNVLDKMPIRGFKKDGETIHGLISLSQVNSAIINLPSAQPEIVRCKDCKWFHDIGCAIQIVDDSDKPSENDYCSFAERRNDERSD